MKRIILTVALCLMASSAFAVWQPPITRGHIQSYNPSFGQQVKVLATWLVSGQGVNRVSRTTYTHDNGCLQVIVTTYAGPFMTGQVTTEFCK